MLRAAETLQIFSASCNAAVSTYHLKVPLPIPFIGSLPAADALVQLMLSFSRSQLVESGVPEDEEPVSYQTAPNSPAE